ncbi:MAG: hypothetical protein L6367_13100 [Cellulomonas sp.]|nr:hypothetical protein [Cellulomonas sp.]
MTVLVGYQWAASPKEATVLEDGSVTWTGANRVVSAADRVAIELACRTAEATGSRTVGVCVTGPQAGADPRARSSALACGPDEVVVVAGGREPDTCDVAAALAAVVAQLGDVDLVVLGDCAADAGTRMVAPVLGGLLGWPTLTEVGEVAPDPAGGFEVVDDSRGARRRTRLTGPAVLGVAVDACVPRQLGLRQILAADSKPSRVVPAAELGSTAPALEVLDRAPVDLGRRRGHVIDEADPARAAALLVDELIEAGAL